MSTKALIILANGFEEMEAIAPIDLLRRAGVDVTVATCEENLPLTGRNDLNVAADSLLDTARADGPYDAVILPGGPGHKTLRKDQRVLSLLREQFEADRLVAAICAAPLVLKEAGILEGRRYTAHFTAAEELPKLVEFETVVEDGNLITSRGAGTATQFGLAIVARLCGSAMAEKIADDIHWNV